MGQPWFRFYQEALYDPKVQLLAPEVFKFWVNCLCLACQNDGVLPEIVDVSYALRLDDKNVVDNVSILEKVGLLDRYKSGILHPHNWDSRQFKSDSSTARVKRFRKRSKTVTETLHETPPEQNRTEQNNTPIIPSFF